jgi:hypothetical protein
MDLFTRIMRRLGLERQAHVIRTHLGILVPGLCIALIVGFWVARVLQVVLRWSSFGPMFNVAVRNPELIVRHSYVHAMLSTIPSLEFAFFLFSLALVLLLIRWTAENVAAYRNVQKQIQYTKHHEHI